MDTGSYGGVLELWWDSLDEVVAALRSPEYLAASAILAEDEARFIDLATSTVFLAEELIMDSSTYNERSPNSSAAQRREEHR